MIIRRILILALLLTASGSYPWGFYAHQMIARNAVFILPREMIGFYKNNIEQLVESSIQPDIRRYVIESEGARHYIDLELYGESPDSVLSLSWNEAKDKYREDTLYARGILPWSIIQTYYSLVEAFKAKDSDRIIRYSADLCHYISDAHVPLHTTQNYDGQLTGQEGIHRLWESLIPENSAKNYTFWVGKAEYITDPYLRISEIILNSHTKVDSVLMMEKATSSSPDIMTKYSFQKRGNQEVKLYSKEFQREYELRLNGMIENQMQSATKMTADFWMTCWIEAGQPDIGGLSSVTEQKESNAAANDSVKIEQRTRLHNN